MKFDKIVEKIEKLLLEDTYKVFEVLKNGARTSIRLLDSGASNPVKVGGIANGTLTFKYSANGKEENFSISGIEPTDKVEIKPIGIESGMKKAIFDKYEMEDDDDINSIKSDE